VIGQQQNTNHADKKSLALSMRTALINRNLTIKHLYPGFFISGCVMSIEDHG
jgi:hypothetical protein